MPSYQAIPDHHEVPINSSLVEQQDTCQRSKARTSILLVFIALIFMTIVLHLKTHQSTLFGFPKSAVRPPKSAVRRCDAKECERADCTRGAPFFCVQPKYHWFYHMSRGGCGSKTWTQEQCAAQCNMSHCLTWGVKCPYHKTETATALNHKRYFRMCNACQFQSFAWCISLNC